MAENDERARKQADELHKVIYEALREGANVSVYVNSPMRGVSGRSYLQDRRLRQPSAEPLNGVSLK
jgi:hypothetical protein